MNRDPLGERFDENMYRIAGNAPALYVDINGLSILGGLRDGWRSLLGKGGCALAFGILSRYADMPQGGDRYAHCMASCRISKYCSKGTAVSAGAAKEVYDLLVCLVTWNADYCYSAFQSSDFEDNKLGRDCPKDKTCVEQCDQQRKRKEGPPGPFYPWPYSPPTDVPYF
jgi:hypothetical protein